MAVILKVTEIT